MGTWPGILLVAVPSIDKSNILSILERMKFDIIMCARDEVEGKQGLEH